MTIAKLNATLQGQQPLRLFSLSTGDLAFPVSSMPNSRLTLKEQRALLHTILSQAIDFFSEDSSSDNTDDEEEDEKEEDKSRGQNQNQ
jgi:hypothetical protein